MMGRFLKFGTVSQRHSKSFGVMPFTLTKEGKTDIILKGLSNPFYADDIRQFQVIDPDKKIFNDLGAKILSYEIVDDDKKAEPALAAVRISDEIVGTQFHPEADAEEFILRIRIYKYAGYFRPEEAEELSAAIRESHTPVPREILRRFIDRYRSEK